MIRDGAVYFSGDEVGEVGEYHTLKNRHPESEIVGNGKQLLMPGVRDGHSHGGGLTFIQCGMTYDYLENVLFDWAFMPGIDPEINAMLSAVRHLRNGCRTIHHSNWDADFNKTLPSGLQEFAAPMVFNDKELIVEKYFKLFDHLYEKYNGENIRVILGPSWVQGSSVDFLTFGHARSERGDRHRRQGDKR